MRRSSFQIINNMEEGDQMKGKEEISEDDDEPRKTNCTSLRIHGFNPDDENFHELWMKRVLGSDLDSQFITNEIILEFWSLVEIFPPGSKEVISVGNMSRRQFVELISCLLFRKSCVYV